VLSFNRCAAPAKLPSPQFASSNASRSSPHSLPLKTPAHAAAASPSSRSAVLRCSSPSPPPRLPASLHGVLSFAAQAPRRRRACQLLFTECCPSLLKPLAAAAPASFSLRSAVPRCCRACTSLFKELRLLVKPQSPRDLVSSALRLLSRVPHVRSARIVR
jgi:hypothetical protein